MCNCFTQVGAIWRLIEWPDFIGAQMFLIETVDCMCKASQKYATQIKENSQYYISCLNNNNNNSSPTNQQQQQQLNNVNSSNTCLANNSSLRSLNNNSSRGTLGQSSADACQKLIIATNNLEKVKESLRGYLIELEMDRYQSQAEKLEKTKLLEANLLNFDSQINQTSDYMGVVIEYILDSIITNKVKLEF